MLQERELVGGVNQPEHMVDSTPETLVMSQTVAPVIVRKS